jgi:hypothetical protein
MGMTKEKILVKGPREKSDLELLVDTGSLYTWVSEDLLKRLAFRRRLIESSRLSRNGISSGLSGRH